MSGHFPLPGPYDPDEEIDTGRTAWDDALYYAERGDESLLIAVLNGDTSLSGDERHMRDFIVGRLTGKIKRPRGRSRPHNDWTFATDFDGTVITCRKKGGPWYNAAAFVRHHEVAMGHDKAVKEAAEDFGMEDESLRKWLTSGPKERAKRFGANRAR
jgi:hypothetical protein